MMLATTHKLDDETFQEYCHRISSEYRIQNRLTWQEVADIINYECGRNYSESYYRKKERQQTVPEEGFAYYEQLLELKKQKVKMFDERVQINALVRQAARHDTLKEIIVDAVNELNEVNPLPNISYERDGFNNENEGLLLISDWHYGKEIHNEFNIFSPEIARKRVYQLEKAVIDKINDLHINTLTVANLGDMVAGNIHLPIRLNARIDVITQIIQVSELLAEFLYNLTSHATIKYISVVDNHSRLSAKKEDSLEKENLYRIIDWYLENRIPEIEFLCNKLDCQDIAERKILNHKIGFIHGHKDGQTKIIEKINGFTGNKYDLICSAHYHHFSSNEEYDTISIANGSLMGVDEYAYDLRLRARPSQTLIEISPKNVVESIHKINLN